MSNPEILMIGAYPRRDMDDLEANHTIHNPWEADDKAAFIARHASRIRVVGTRGDLTCGADIINALPRLEIIGCYGVGTDGIDFAAARPRGIKATNTPDVLTDDVADLDIARGAVVDEEALIVALRNKTIKGAALDVYLNEPNIDERFLALENAVLPPHIGSASIETRKTAAGRGEMK